MSAKVQAIRSYQGGPRDPDRLALSVAIAAVADARRAVDNAKAAIGRAHRMVDLAEERVALATEGITAARDAMARNLTRGATEGTVLAPDPSMRAARDRLTDAEDERDVARAALSATEALLEGGADALKAAEKRVAELARVVLSQHIEPAVTDVARIKDALNSAMGTLWLLHRECYDWPPTAESDRLKFLLYPPALNLTETNHGAVRWIEYLEALKLSADAAPPSL